MRRAGGEAGKGKMHLDYFSKRVFGLNQIWLNEKTRSRQVRAHSSKRSCSISISISIPISLPFLLPQSDSRIKDRKP